ncbi:MAG: ferrous iron transport protein B [Anaerolineales bacterium]|nr:ferrous iron transport protein B [Anaerolineales bacterium]
MQTSFAPPAPFRLDYGRDLEAEIARLLAAFAEQRLDTSPYPPRWLALKLLENEEDIAETIAARPGGASVVRLARERAAYLQNAFGEEADLMLADRRYGFISSVVRQTLTRPALDRVSLSDRIDDVVTHRWLGLPIFFAVMYVVFRLVIDVSAPFLDWVDAVINGPVARWFAALLTALAAPDWLRSLVIDGVVAGVGGVLVFVPGLMVLFFFLALLEDSGYLARAAFVMDRFMRVVGLHGKSFIPMVLGFGCAVPAIYATRTLAGHRDRVLTALLVPLMSCSARLPVYVVFGLAFFGARAGTVIWLLYALGILVAMLAGWVFTRTLLRPDRTSAFVLELPPYRRPALHGLFIHMWAHTREFVHKAGTVILGVSVLLWFLLNLPWGVADPRDSYFGRVSAAISPAFAPLGFGNWETAGALVTGFAAKEVVVSTLSQIYVGGAEEEAEVAAEPTLADDAQLIFEGFLQATADAGRMLLSIIPGVSLTDSDAEPEDTALSRALRQNYSPLAAFALLVFVLLYVPCVATLGAIRHEFGWRWAAVSAVYQIGAAWVAALLVYQGGRLLGLG